MLNLKRQKSREALKMNMDQSKQPEKQLLKKMTPCKKLRPKRAAKSPSEGSIRLTCTNS